MPSYIVTVTRSYRAGEEAQLTVEAETPEAAIEKVQQLDDDESLEWHLFDNEDCEYRWTACHPDAPSEVLATIGE